MSTFVFKDYNFDADSLTATFRYAHKDPDINYQETFSFPSSSNSYDANVLDSAMELAFYLVGVSYYKSFPHSKLEFNSSAPNHQQAEFLNIVYRNGLSQYLFENNLKPEDIVDFSDYEVTTDKPSHHYNGQGTVALQSGGKDSLLTASILEEKSLDFMSLYISSSEFHPAVLDTFTNKLFHIRRRIDTTGLKKAQSSGGYNGHVPITYIVLSIATIAVILQNRSDILVSIGSEGEEPHSFIGDIAINHQWSKTWQAEKMFSDYMSSFISKDIKVGSPLRAYSELKISELFVEKSWSKYKNIFSSCNRANYKLGEDNRELKWCGDCPKCANSFLLFAPFVEPKELIAVMGGNLIQKPELKEVFKGLLSIDGVPKPFECVGEADELRLAYQMTMERWVDVYDIGFDVPSSNFDYEKISPHNENIKLN
jgi:hypothetical protein